MTECHFGEGNKRAEFVPCLSFRLVGSLRWLGARCCSNSTAKESAKARPIAWRHRLWPVSSCRAQEATDGSLCLRRNATQVERSHQEHREGVYAPAPRRGNYLVMANSATMRDSTSMPFANDASGIRSSSPCMRFKSSCARGNGHRPYDCTLWRRNCAESVAHGD